MSWTGDGGSVPSNSVAVRLSDAPRQFCRPQGAGRSGWLRLRRDRRRRFAERDPHLGGKLELLADPPADRVVAAREVPCIVGVEALDAGSRAADPTTRPRSGMVVGNQRVALGRVTAVGVVDERRVDRRLGGAHATGRLELADSTHLVGTDQPVAGRHRGAVVEQRRVPQHDGITIVTSHDDLEVAERLTTEELAYPRPVVHRVSGVDAAAGTRAAVRAPPDRCASTAPGRPCRPRRSAPSRVR